MAMLIHYTSAESIHKNNFNHLLFHVHACMHTYAHIQVSWRYLRIPLPVVPASNVVRRRKHQLQRVPVQ